MRPSKVWLMMIVTFLLATIASAQSPKSSDVNVTGKWQGTRRTTGLGNAVNQIRSIKFDLTQRDKMISGSYKCYAGKKASNDCANPVGRITSGTFDGSKLNIDVQILPNNSKCWFKGAVAGDKIKGTYTCYVGGSLSSIGVWEVHRH
jgi:hypothetical protein